MGQKASADLQVGDLNAVREAAELLIASKFSPQKTDRQTRSQHNLCPSWSGMVLYFTCVSSAQARGEAVETICDTRFDTAPHAL